MAASVATKRASRPRTVAPKATTQAEVPATNKPSIWTRIKTAAQKTAAVIAKPFKAVAAKIKPTSKKVATTVSKPFKAAARFVSRISRDLRVSHVNMKAVLAGGWRPVDWSLFGWGSRAMAVVVMSGRFVSTFWARSLKPMLLGLIGGVALFGFFVAAIVAPITTSLVLLLAGGLVVGLALGVKYLEEHEATSRLARITLRILDALVLTGTVFVYAAAALTVFTLCLTSFTFFAFTATFLTLTYLQVRGAASIAFVAWAVVSGNWMLALLWALLFVSRIPTRTATRDAAIPTYSEIRRKPEVHENVRRATQQPAQPAQPAQPTGNFLRAKGTEELWGTEHDAPPAADWDWTDIEPNYPCVACRSTTGAMRIATDGPVDTHGLCGACFDLQCEEDALRFTGVSLKARSVEVRLNQKGIEHSKEFSASKFDSTSFHWMESAWWRDRGGAEYAREKLCLMDGREVARVVHDYKRKVYRASVLGQLVRNGVKTTWEMAQSAAQDELNDERAAVRRHEEAAEEVIGEAPARLVLQGV